MVIAQRSVSSAPMGGLIPTDSSGFMIVTDGKGADAEQYLRTWLNGNLNQYLKITDPYFGPDELEALLWVLETGKSVEVAILTSAAYQKQQRVDLPWEAAVQSVLEEVVRNRPSMRSGMHRRTSVLRGFTAARQVVDHQGGRTPLRNLFEQHWTQGLRAVPAIC